MLSPIGIRSELPFFVRRGVPRMWLQKSLQANVRRNPKQPETTGCFPKRISADILEQPIVPSCLGFQVEWTSFQLKVLGLCQFHLHHTHAVSPHTEIAPSKTVSTSNICDAGLQNRKDPHLEVTLDGETNV